MPSYSNIVIQNFLEPSVRDSFKKPVEISTNETAKELGQSNPRFSRHLYISPTLYATPQQTPISEYSSLVPHSPSPYVVNHKGRRGGIDPVDADSCQKGPSFKGGDVDLEEVVGYNFVNGERLELVANGGEDGEEISHPREHNIDVGSDREHYELGRNQVESRSFVSAQGEFFDAIEDFSAEVSTLNMHSFSSTTESELHATKCSVLEEIEKRKIAEETLALMRSQWERICYLLLQANLTFPAPSASCDIKQLGNNLIDQFCQEVCITRFVSEAVGRGQGRAEAEESAVAIIELKNQEIARLRDRLQYYETVNHEMSQRKLVDVVRRQQERKTKWHRWLWSILGLSIGLGASFAAYSYLPQASIFESLQIPDDTADSFASVSPDVTS